MQLDTDFIITMDDCIKAGHCPAGVRRWFNNQGIDFRAFMRDGVPASVLLASGDANGRQVVERTMQRKLIGIDLPGAMPANARMACRHSPSAPGSISANSPARASLQPISSQRAIPRRSRSCARS
jgi:hypothetical protein